MQISYIKHPDYLEVLVEGAYSQHIAVEAFADVLARCRNSGVSRVLVNYCGLSMLGGLEQSVYAFGVERTYHNHLTTGGTDVQFAYLKKEIEEHEPGARILEMSAIPFKLFEDLREAEQWLGLRPHEAS